MYNIALIGNCQMVSLSYFLEELLKNNQNYTVKWCLYGNEFKGHLGSWSDMYHRVI